jgi:probable HAF family extracellular repeat protein
MGARTWKQRTRRAYVLCTSRRVRTSLVAVGCALSLILLGAGQAQAACSLVPTVTDLGNPQPSGLGAFATGINSRGQIVGWSRDQTGTLDRPFLWNPTSPNASSGAFTDLAALPDSAEPAAINSNGQVAATYRDPQTAFLRAVLWTPDAPNATTGKVTELGGISVFGSEALAMNDYGQVVGTSPAIGFWDHAFLWTPNQPNGTTGTMVDLGVFQGGNTSGANSINAAGVVVGWSQFQIRKKSGIHAFRWTPTTPNGTTGKTSDLGVLPSDNSSFATGINSRGDIVGYDWSSAYAEDNVIRPWFLTEKLLVPFPKMPPEFDTTNSMTGATIPGQFVPNAVNGQRMVVGWSLDYLGNVWKAALWTPPSRSAPTGTFVELGGTPTSPVNLQAIALNDHAQVVGAGAIYHHPSALLWTLTPDCK